MIFTVTSNILLGNSNLLTSSPLDEDSKKNFTFNRNQMSTLDKTHRGIKKISGYMTSRDEMLLISSRG